MNAPQLQHLSGDVCVAPQLDADAMAWVAESGFKSVVNNRPDYEGGPDQPTNAVIEAAAAAAGLRYAWLPVLPTVQTTGDIAHFAALLVELPKPILAFCRTGTRSEKLYRAATGN